MSKQDKIVGYNEGYKAGYRIGISDAIGEIQAEWLTLPAGEEIS